MAKKNTKNDPVGDFLGVFLIRLGVCIKNAYKGLKKLNKPIPIGGFVLMSLISILVTRNQAKLLAMERLLGTDVPILIRYLGYIVLLLSPLWYLMVLGQAEYKQAVTYQKIFEDIGFIGKDKQYPVFVAQKEEDQKVILVFKSNIPRVEWEKQVKLLETAFDCSIRKVREGSGKKIVELVTVPSDYKIPDIIRWKDEYISSEDGVLCIGESDLQRVTFDLNRTPHVLAAGETGSGKSVVLRTMLWQMIHKGCRLYMIDFKGGVEFGKAYERYGEVITERERALEVLQMLVEENAKRLHLFRELEVKNLKEYNQKTGENLCRIGVFIDEIAEMLDKKGVPKEQKAIYEQLEGALSTLARLSRATGINLFLGVQRPDANVLTGQIKNNVPVRISGRFADKSASEIVLGNTSAYYLPEIKGRFLFKMGNEEVEFQGYWFDDDTDLKKISVQQGTMMLERGAMSGLARDEKAEPIEPTPIPEVKSGVMRSEATSPSTPSKKINLAFTFDEIGE